MSEESMPINGELEYANANKELSEQSKASTEKSLEIYKLRTELDILRQELSLTREDRDKYIRSCANLYVRYIMPQDTLVGSGHKQ